MTIQYKLIDGASISLTITGATIYSDTFKNVEKNSIKTVTIPADVTSIDKNAFYNCTNLTTVTIEGNTLKTIGDYAFWYCQNFSDYADKILSVGGEDNDGREENKNVWIFSNGIATYTENGEKKIEITDLKNAENIVVNEKAKTATISEKNFDAKDISISGDFTLKLDKNYPIKTAAAHFENFTYKSTSNTEGYMLFVCSVSKCICREKFVYIIYRQKILD